MKVDVQPSIQVNSIITASHTTPNNYWMALEIENLCAQPVSVSSILALTKHWEVKATIGAESNEGESSEAWLIPPQQLTRIFLRIFPVLHDTEEVPEEVSVLTSISYKRLLVSSYYESLESGEWSLPELLTWRKKWMPKKDRATSGDSSELILSDVPTFSFLHRERGIGALHERKIKLKNLITPPLATYIDGGSDHTEQDRKKKAEEQRNIINTQHLLHLVLNWSIASDAGTCFGQFNLREISVTSTAVETDEKQAPLPKRRNSLVTLIEAQEELQLERSPLLFTVHSDQNINDHNFSAG